jgi:putative addiction module component (TIGR02574 family)
MLSVSDPEEGAMIQSMNARTKKLRDEVLKLPRKQRAELAYDAVRSLDEGPEDAPEDVERAWAQEIDRRIRDVKEGRAKLVPADQVFAEARERSKRARSQRRAR